MKKNKKIDMLKWLAVVIIVISTLPEVRCQELLRKNIAEVRNYMQLQKGIAGSESGTPDIRSNTREKMLTYTLSESSAKKDGIFMQLFFFSNSDICVRYTTSYVSHEYLAQLTRKLDNPHSGLKRLNKALTWTSRKDNSIVVSIMTTHPDSKGHPFVLDVRERNYIPPNNKITPQEFKKLLESSKP
jgi:hypothetical protein